MKNALCAGLSREQSNALYLQVMQDQDIPAMQALAKSDIFFLGTQVCRRPDLDHPWLYDRCREWEAAPDGFLDLWGREHRKSTIITFLGSVQEILNDPETTIGIFSHTRPIAKGFLWQIKTELEKNTMLLELFPDILWSNPDREAPRWSMDFGIVVKRRTNPKESTVEAWGLVDGQPTSKHFRLLVYDDVVTRESVNTPDQIRVTTDAWAVSLNLGVDGGKKRYAGTRWHYNDTYREILARKAVTARVRPATDDGTAEGRPVLFSQEVLDEKRREMGPYVFGAQMLLNPTADRAQGFREDWLRFYDGTPRLGGWNVFAVVDPASKKKRDSDYSVMAVVGWAPDGNKYLIDGVRDRMSLTQRTEQLFRFVRRYHPIAVGYEEYGLQCDREHIEFVEGQLNYRFTIKPLGGQVAKVDRIRGLVPVFEAGRFWLPRRLLFTAVDGTQHDFVREFLDDEYNAFPVSVHDDMLDCLARTNDPDLGATFPEELTEEVLRDARTVSEYSVLALAGQGRG